LIAVDTNILVYAHREDSEWHDAAYARLAELAEGRATWAIPWPCVHEFLAVVTHRRIFSPPTPLEAALDQADAWFESPSLVMFAESNGYWSGLRQLLKRGRVAGRRVHDARVAAICAQHGVRTIWSADRDFGRFPGIEAINPLLG
jgi:toxin-antitoxin system PIN domain toxin